VGLHLLSTQNDKNEKDQIQQFLKILQQTFKYVVSSSFSSSSTTVVPLSPAEDKTIFTTDSETIIDTATTSVKNKLMKLVEEGRDAEVDDEIQAAKKKREKERIAAEEEEGDCADSNK